MLLSTKGRYAVMAMVEVASEAASTPLSLAEIAQRLDLSHDYLEQLFMRMRRAGLVRSVRGPGGGYQLANTPENISIYSIMAAVDEGVKMTRCGGEAVVGCVASKRCKTHHLWDALGGHISEFLQGASLADVVNGRLSNKHAIVKAVAVEVS